MLTPYEPPVITTRAEAQATIRHAFRYGLLIGIVLGVVAALMVFGLVH